MEKKRKNKQLKLVRKWGRLLLAIASAILLLNQPAFSFVDEPGLESNRIFTMTTRTFEMHHIEMATGIDHLIASTSVKGFFYGALIILLACVICTVFYSFHRFRILMSSITAFLAGTYYLIMMYYAIRLSQDFFLILYPNFIALLPSVIIIIMLSIRKETVNRLIRAREKAEESL